MPLLAKLDGVTLSGTGQNVLALDLGGGVFVNEIFVKNASGANPVTTITPKERPYEGGPQIPVGTTIVASVAAGAASGLVIGRHLEWLDVVATQGAGGNTVDIAVTGGIADA
jgi:hypothetical protein